MRPGPTLGSGCPTCAAITWLGAWPPLECHSASTTVTMVSHRVIRLRGTWVSATQASAAYQANTQGATRIHANVSANGATTSRGWSEEIRW